MAVILALRQYPQGGITSSFPRRRESTGRGRAPWSVIADQVRNDVTMRCIVFTLTFDSSPIKGEGVYGCVVLLSPRPVDSRLRGNDGEGRLE